jgi:hypothetical protein
MGEQKRENRDVQDVTGEEREHLCETFEIEKTHEFVNFVDISV